MEENLINIQNFQLPKSTEVRLQKIGISKLHSEQSETLNSIFNSKDCLVITPTGSGKSLAYLTYAMSHSGLVVVISPLIALIKDQIKELEKHDFKAAAIHSNMTPEEKRAHFEMIETKQSNLLFVSPERFNQKPFRAWILKKDVELIVIDEAHCVSHWGYGFRPDYRKIGKHISQFSNTTKLALTATATQDSMKDIIWHLGLNSPTIIRRSPIQKNTSIQVASMRSVQEQQSKILDIVESHADLSGVVFCATVNDACIFANVLKKSKIRSILFHGRMTGEEKSKAYRAMRDSDHKIIVATKAFSLGVNLQNLDFVIHKGIPENLEGYLQEVGRVGRKTKKTLSSIIYTTRDVAIRKFMNQKSYPDENLIAPCIDFFVEQLHQKKQTSCDDFTNFCEAELKLSDKKKTKTQKELLEFFQREQIIKVWQHYDFDTIEINDSLEQLEFFLREYKVRKKIHQRQFEDVLSFLKSRTPVEFLRDYYEA